MYFCRGGWKFWKFGITFFFLALSKIPPGIFVSWSSWEIPPEDFDRIWFMLELSRIYDFRHVPTSAKLDGGGHFFHNFWASFFVFRLIGYQNWWKIWMQLGPAVLNLPLKTKKTQKWDSYCIFKFLARMYPKVPRNFLKVPEISLFVHLGQKYRFFANRPKCPKMSF